MIPAACDLACLVRDWDQAGIARRLTRLSVQELHALAVVMAAMIPDDAPVSDLLGWLEPGTPQRDAMLRKAHGRASGRQRVGLPLWGPLAALEREFQAGARARRRDAAGDGEDEAAA